MSYQNHSHHPGLPERPVNDAGPTVEEEEALLRVEFGLPNEDGMYGTVVVE